jgi:hypothetical protein
MILLRPVAPRARRIALMPASVPLLTRRTCSTAGHLGDDGLGQFGLALGRCAEAEAVAAAFCTASSTAGWPWPRIIGPQEPM